MSRELDPPPQRMAPAPRLPPVLDGTPQVVLAPPALPEERDEPLHRTEDSRLGLLDAAIVAQHRRVTELHQQFMRQQATLYEKLHTLLVAGGASHLHPATPAEVEWTLDPAQAAWLADHCPSWTVPVMPAMGIAELLAQAAASHTGKEVVGVQDLQLRRWLVVPGPVRLRTAVSERSASPTVTLWTWHAARSAELSRFVPVASGQVLLGDAPEKRPPRFAPLADALPVKSPYATAELFHGPSFQYLVSLRVGSNGASGVLEIGRGRVPSGVLHPGLLDAAMHTIPGSQLEQWSAEIERSRIGFPHRLRSLTRFEPLPNQGTLEVESRFAGFDDGNRALPMIELQLCRDERVLVAFRMVLILIAHGRPEEVRPSQVRLFARERRYVQACLLSAQEGDATVLQRSAVEALDFVPGTVAALYSLTPRWQDRDELPLLAAKEHLARRLRVHPGTIELDDELRTGWHLERPHERHPLAVTSSGDTAWVRDASSEALGKFS